MPEPSIDQLAIGFGDCKHGWIRMTVIANDYAVTVDMSHWLDPLPEMLAWLQAIATGTEECAFRVDQEEDYVKFSARTWHCAHPKQGSYTHLSVTPERNVPPLAATLRTCDLVRIFYQAIRDFALSEDYVREHWERMTLEQVLYEKTGMASGEWINSVIALEPRELQMVLWKLDPCITSNPENWHDNIGTESELMELTGHTREQAGGLPEYWMLPQELWAAYANGSEQAKCEYLAECLSDNMTAWDGTPWRKMRLLVIEKWLESEYTDNCFFWQRWLVDDESPAFIPASAVVSRTSDW